MRFPSTRSLRRVPTPAGRSPGYAPRLLRRAECLREAPASLLVGDALEVAIPADASHLMRDVVRLVPGAVAEYLRPRVSDVDPRELRLAVVQQEIPRLRCHAHLACSGD